MTQLATLPFAGALAQGQRERLRRFVSLFLRVTYKQRGLYRLEV